MALAQDGDTTPYMVMHLVRDMEERVVLEKEEYLLGERTALSLSHWITEAAEAMVIKDKYVFDNIRFC